MATEREKKLKGFKVHGVDFMTGTEEDSQAEGCCPFCHGTDKFFVNTSTYLWDCKRCGRNGNFQGFLEQKSEVNRPAFAGAVAERLAKAKKLPTRALRAMGWGWDGGTYTLAVRTGKGGVTDVRRYRTKWERVMATPGADIGLGHAERIKGCKGFVWICEGEWDAAALWYALKIAGRTEDVVTWVPGANTFKTKLWADLFKGKHVICAYDFDEAGERGVFKVAKNLKDRVKRLRFVTWPTNSKDGYDVRDFITRRMAAKRVKTAAASLLKLVTDQPAPRVWWVDKDAPAADLVQVDGGGVREFDGAAITAEETVEGYRQFLELKDPTVLDVIFGTIFANRIDGDPLWTYIVGSAGAAKSELLMSLDDCEEVKCISTLTPQGFVSGAPDMGGTDPSLYAEIIGKVLVMKDMTAVFSLRSESVAELFGYFRDAYDGKMQKKFGTGVIRSYTGTFGFLAGVTPALDAYTSADASLGERFLKYRLPKQSDTETDKILRATIASVTSEPAKRTKLKEVAYKTMNRDMPDVLPTVGPEAITEIIRWGHYTARMRAHVMRDKYDKDMVLARPDTELPTRLVKQFTKMAIGIAIFRGHSEVGDHELRIIKQIAKDTPPDRAHDIVEALVKISSSFPGRGGRVTLKQLQERTGYPRTTLQRKLADMRMLGLVKQEKESGGGAVTYKLTAGMKALAQ